MLLIRAAEMYTLAKFQKFSAMPEVFIVLGILNSDAAWNVNSP